MIENLTPREREVLQLIAAGRSTKALAADLAIAFKTAACHRATILAKLGAANTADLVCRAVRMGLVNVQPPVEQHDPPAIAMRIEALQTANRSAVENLRVALDQTRVLIFETARARDLLRRAREELRTPGRPPQTDERAEFVPPALRRDSRIADSVAGRRRSYGAARQTTAGPATRRCAPAQAPTAP